MLIGAFSATALGKRTPVKFDQQITPSDTRKPSLAAGGGYS